MIIVKIDKEVPFAPNIHRGTKYVLPWTKMDVGDSFVFPNGISERNARARASYHSTEYGACAKIGIEAKFRVAKQPDGKFRCWRIE